MHGFYSVNGYSAIMTRGECVIAEFESVREYNTRNHPATSPDADRFMKRALRVELARLLAIHRGTRDRLVKESAL